MAFCWTHSIVSMSCLVLEISTPGPALHLCLTNANRGKESPPLTCWWPSAVGLCCKGTLPVLQVPQVLFCKAAFQILWLSMHWEWGYSSPGAGLDIFLSWTAQGCCQPISPARPSPPGWQTTILVYQSLLSLLQICWGCTLPHHPGH